MADSIVAQVAELQRLSAAQLRIRMQGITGRPCRQTHRRYLIKRLAFLIQEKHYGGLSDAAEDQIATQVGPLHERSEEVIDERKARQGVTDNVIGGVEPLEIVTSNENIESRRKGGDYRRRHQHGKQDTPPDRLRVRHQSQYRSRMM